MKILIIDLLSKMLSASGIKGFSNQLYLKKILMNELKS